MHRLRRRRLLHLTKTFNKDIQALVLKHVARIDNGVIAQRVKFPKEWIGIWLKQFSTPELLKKNLNYRQVRR